MGWGVLEDERYTVRVMEASMGVGNEGARQQEVLGEEKRPFG